MKRVLLTSLSVLAAASLSMAQQQRLVLLEHFTQASCGPCASQNPALNALLDQNLDKVVAIKYQTSWPGVDPMNAANATDVQTRVDYYAVNGVPNSQMDGNFYEGSPGGVTQSKIDQRYGVNAGIAASVHYTIIDSPDPVSDSMLLNVTVTATTDIPAGYVLHTVAIEREIEFATAPGTNGEKKFESVMKKMFPSASGSVLPAMSAGEVREYSFKWSLTRTNGTPVYYNIGQAAAVAFIQNNTTKEVLQAAYDEPRPWLSLTKEATVKGVRIKAGEDVLFPFTAVSKTEQNQIIKLNATVTGLPTGWTATIESNGTSYPSPALLVLTGNSAMPVSVKISGPNDGNSNKKIAVKLEANSETILPSVKNTMNFTAVTPSNIMYVDLAGTGTTKFSGAFNAMTQPFVSLNATEAPELDSEGLTAANIKKIFYSTGAAYSGTLTPTNVLAFTNYLNSGGNLFVMGQDIGYEMAAAGSVEGQDFYGQYMGAEYMADGATSTVTVAAFPDDEILAPHIGTGTISISGSTNYPDQLLVSGAALGTAAPFLYYASGNGDATAGIYNYTDTWKVVYVGFRMEAIGSSAVATTFRNNMIKTANNWFDNVLTANQVAEAMQVGAAYPNPAKNVLQVPVAKGNGTVSLTNVAGKTVRSISVAAPANTVKTIQLDGLAPGMYFLENTTENGVSTTQKIVVE